MKRTLLLLASLTGLVLATHTQHDMYETVNRQLLYPRYHDGELDASPIYGSSGAVSPVVPQTSWFEIDQETERRMTALYNRRFWQNAERELRHAEALRKHNS